MRALATTLGLAVAALLFVPQTADAQNVTIRPRTPFFQPVSPVWYPSFYNPAPTFYSQTYVYPTYTSSYYYGSPYLYSTPYAYPSYYQAAPFPFRSGYVAPSYNYYYWRY